MDTAIIAAIITGVFALIAAITPILLAKRRAQHQVSDTAKLPDRRARRTKHSGIILDLSHEQRQWRGFIPMSHCDVKEIDQGIVKQRGIIDKARILWVILPWHSSFTDEEIDYIEQWVSTGGGLALFGYYLADSHHVCNVNALARRFDFEFAENLLMPLGRTSLRDCLDQAFEINGTDHSVTIHVASSEPHPIAQGVKEVSFLSSCSLANMTRNVECVIYTPRVAVMHAVGHKHSCGWMIKIDDWVLDREDSLPVLAAWRHGRGKVVAVGTWKICSQDLGDNVRILNNILAWLGQ